MYNNNNATEKLEVGEILARLNAGIISKEEAQNQLEKFNTSPIRIIEEEEEDAILNDGAEEEEYVNSAVKAIAQAKSKRGRPRGSRNKKSKKNVSDEAVLLQTLKSMDKIQLKRLLRQLKHVHSDEESDDDDGDQRVEELSSSSSSSLPSTPTAVPEQPNDKNRYVPAFIETKINLTDKSEFDFNTMVNIIKQISRDKCTKSEAQRRVCEYLNKYYGVVTNQGHETIMVTKIYKPEFGFCELAEISINSFRSNFSNLEVVYVLPNKQVKVRKLGDFYIESPYRLNYTRIVFNPHPANHPNAASSKELNTFSGLPFTEEECRKCYDDTEVRFKMEWIRSEYVKRTVCNKDDFAFQVFEHWFGAKIREPWRKLNWMVLFYGGFGSGKSTLMRKIIKVIFGLYCKVVSDIKAVFGEFDSIKRNALIIMLDENVAPETKAQEAKLTSEITSNMITANEKFKRTEQVVSFHEYIGGVNPKNKVFLKLGDRRVFVIKTNEEMTLSHQWEKEKVEYWNKVNEYLDDVRVVKAYQYHLQCMLVPNPNIKIGLHAPYSKIKDELMLLQSPDSLHFAKIILERGFIVPQSRLSDARQELNKHFTNVQGRLYDQAKNGYDSPWVRELCTKDVEKEFRLLFPHSPMKNNTLWRELCYIFDIKTSEEERIRDSPSEVLMIRFHKNPNVKAKITNAIGFKTKPSLIKKIVDKNGKIKDKVYYVWPSFYDAYTQFTSKTKIIIELSPTAKTMFEEERTMLSTNRKRPFQSIQNEQEEETILENRRQATVEEEVVEQEDGPESPPSRPLKKRRRMADVSKQQEEVPQLINDQLKLMMEELKSTKEHQKKMEDMMMEKLASLRQIESPIAPVQDSVQKQNVLPTQPTPPPPPSAPSLPQQPQSQPQLPSPSTPLRKESQTNDHYMPYPVQQVISSFNLDDRDQSMHFDTQHQSQELAMTDYNPATMTCYNITEDSCDVPMITLATPLLQQVDPSTVQQTVQHNGSLTPKRITNAKMFKALNNNNNN